MRYSNYPDGMRESDIPGYDDIECPYCEEHEQIVLEEEGEVESIECPVCNGSGVTTDKIYNEYLRRTND